MLMAQEPTALIEYLRLIPEYVWALFVVIIGGSLTWVGIYLQLRHDSKEKEKERKMSLRKDIFLLLMKDIGQMLYSLAYFYHQDISSPGGSHTAMVQVDLIGKKETIQATNELNDQIAKAFFELIPEKEEITILYEKINDESDLVAKGLKDVSKCVEEVTKLVEEIVVRVDKLAGKCQKQCKLCQKLFVSVIVAMREELDIKFDEAAYLAMMGKSHSEWEEDFQKYTASMNRIPETLIQRLSSYLPDNKESQQSKP